MEGWKLKKHVTVGLDSFPIGCSGTRKSRFLELSRVSSLASNQMTGQVQFKYPSMVSVQVPVMVSKIQSIESPQQLPHTSCCEFCTEP